ncbi:MAG: hypothetical protein HW416_2741 [Chloroflexi bacterium]|nr:hypothetical protein [Chloroflexota bacterium]
MEFPRQHVRSEVVRSRFILEMASELVGYVDWAPKQTQLQMRIQGDQFPWDVRLFGSDAPNVFEPVARGEVHLAMVNPSGALAMAVQGTGPFKAPLPLRVITVLPSHDQFAFAVAERTGLRSLEEIGERRYPLRVAMRDRPEHSDYLYATEALAAAGFSWDDLFSWGGSLVHYRGLGVNVGAVERGEVDAIFEEAVKLWLERAIEAGMRVLSLSEPVLAKLESVGLRRASITRREYPKLPEDVVSLDFSGWPAYTSSETPDQLVEWFCTALEARRDRIPCDGGVKSLPLDRMCIDAPDAPLTAPFHPAAERFWRQRGYIQ